MGDFYFEYQLNDLLEYADALARRFEKTVDGSTLSYPAHIAEGGSRFYRVDDYISFQIAHYHTRQRMIFKRSPHHPMRNHTTISFQEFTFANPGSADNEVIFYNNGLGSVLCRSVNVAEAMIIEPDTEVRVLLVLLKENWMENVLKNESHKLKFQKYFGDAHANFSKEFLGPPQMEMLKEIFSPVGSRAISNMYHISRVMNLLENFLTEVLQKDEREGALLFAKADDIRKMQEVAELIDAHPEQPFFGVDYLSRRCYMSRTKFINLFQKIYGMSAYDYHQRKRLNIAYDSLKSGRLSVAEVAESVGYASVTNFCTAFKKVFGKPPKELVAGAAPGQLN